MNPIGMQVQRQVSYNNSIQSITLKHEEYYYVQKLLEIDI